MHPHSAPTFNQQSNFRTPVYEPRRRIAFSDPLSSPQSPIVGIHSQRFPGSTTVDLSGLDRHVSLENQYHTSPPQNFNQNQFTNYDTPQSNFEHPNFSNYSMPVQNLNHQSSPMNQNLTYTPTSNFEHSNFSNQVIPSQNLNQHNLTVLPTSAQSANDLLLAEIKNISLNVNQQLQNFRQEIPQVVQYHINRSQPPPQTIPPPISQVTFQPTQNVAESIAQSNTSPSFLLSQGSIQKPKLFGTRRFRDLKSFNGSLSPLHPKDFINEVKIFFEVNQTTDLIKIYEVGSLMEGKARHWYSFNKDRFDSFDKFCDEFLTYFWSKSIQDEIRESLYQRHQYDPAKGDLASYFLANVNKVKYLEPVLDEASIISALTKHFPEKVRLSFGDAELRSVRAMLDKLQHLDRIISKPSKSENKPQLPNFQVKPPFSKPMNNAVRVNAAEVDDSQSTQFGVPTHLPPPGYNQESSLN